MINEKAKDKLIVALDYNNMEDAKRNNNVCFYLNFLLPSDGNFY